MDEELGPPLAVWVQVCTYFTTTVYLFYYYTVPSLRLTHAGAGSVGAGVLILLYMCPHTAIYVSSYFYMCPHTTIYVSSYFYMCVLILLYTCPHTPICVLILLCVCPHTAIYVLYVSSYCCRGRNARRRWL